MSVICNAIKNTSKSDYKNSNEFVGVMCGQRPNVSIAQNWNIEQCFLPKKYAKFGDAILNFKVRPDDVWIISYPKCGTTWTQDLIWLLCNNLDYDTDGKVLLQDRYIFIESITVYDHSHPDPNYVQRNTVELANQCPSPRFLKSHLPIHLLPTQLWTVKPKIIYAARNPKDAAISYYHHWKNLHSFKGDLNDFLDIFMKDQVLWSPFHSHVSNFWAMRMEENILFLTYEDMKNDLISVLRQAMQFLNKSYSNQELTKLSKYLDFESMRLNPCTNQEAMMNSILIELNEQRLNNDYRYECEQNLK